MSGLFDDFGFLAVVLQGLDLVAQTVLLGSLSFALFVIEPLARDPGNAQPSTDRALRGPRGTTRTVTVAGALVTTLTATLTALVTALVLATSLDIRWHEIVGAAFVTIAATKATAALVIAVVLTLRGVSSRVRWLACIGAAAVVLGAAVADTHAVARISESATLLGATAAHTLGAGLWLGGLPCFWLALRDADAPLAETFGKRFSVVAASGVALIVAGAALFCVYYIGSVDAVYGTAYGAMAATKTLLLAMLLALGWANYRIVHGTHYGAGATRRVMRFVEIEIAIGVAVLIAAASITSATPSVDVADRVTLQELVHRMKPVVPRMTSPPHRALGAAGTLDAAARNAEDRAWSEYNHHWSGVVVVLMGLAALAQRSGRARFAAHWPLLFLLLAAFLLLRADPEVWPLGPIGPLESLRDPEVVQHRLFVVLIAAFAVFEWRVRTGRMVSRSLPRVFPVACAAGGALLLMHSHAVDNVKEQLLIEMSHLPIAVLGIVAGCARWLELAAPRDEGRAAGWVWPAAFVLVGLLLLDYREA
jgi:putative copper resistance protein D